VKILSQATVHGEFNNTSAADIVAPLRPHIAGPEADLHRYAVAAEKPTGLLGDYDYTQDTDYDWPNQAVGSLVDLNSVSIHIDNALLRYFQDSLAVGSSIAAVGSYKNRIATAAAQGFKANGSSYPRLAALGDRDVAVGDVVKLYDGTRTLWTYVAGLIADVVAGSPGSATSDAANPVSRPNSDPATAPTVSVTGGGSSGGSLAAGTYFVRYTFAGPFGETSASDAATFTSASGNIPRVTIPSLPTGATSAKIYLSPTGGTAAQCTLYASGITGTTADLDDAYASGGAAAPLQITQTSGTSNNVSGALDNSLYNGTADGDLTDVYTVTVIQAPTSAGDATTALLSVTSASGRDDVASFAPAAYSSATSIGTRGTKVTFSTSGGDDFVVGQTWQVQVGQAWTAPVATSSGTYSDTETSTYIVTVTRGGLYADSVKPQITVSKSNGTDVSGPTTVTAAASAVVAGSLGVQIQFSGTGLRLGDIYYIPVTGATSGAYKTILLGHNMVSAMSGASDLTLTLYLKKSIVVDAHRVSSPPDLNWSATIDTLTVKAGILAYDSTLTSSGVQVATPVEGGDLYVSYRAWKNTHAEKITQVSTLADVALEFGYDSTDDIDADDPLAYAVTLAVTNANGQPVKFSGVADPSDSNEWAGVLRMLVGDPTVSELVPLTRDTAVRDAYIAHVARVDSEDVDGEWRHAWFNLEAVSDVAIVDSSSSSDELTVLATLSDNPAVSGTQYTLLACTSNNGNFVTNGVARGDVVRFLHTVDAYGAATYTTFLVESVVNEDTIILQSGHSIAVSTAQKVEIWRSLSKDQIASDLVSSLTGALINRNLRFVWPDKVTNTKGVEVEGYFLCAAYAGFRGGIVPQQGLQNVAISGFLSTPRSNGFFNNGQLNTLRDHGCFVVSTATTGEVYAYAARTPDLSSVSTREEAMVFRDDAIRYLFFGSLDQFRGQANVNSDVIALIDVELKAAGLRGAASTRVDRIGALLNSATVTTIRQHESIPDRMVVQLSVNRDTVLDTTAIVITF
jgi:hypothetical protein